jgi:hypothetical protein
MKLVRPSSKGILHSEATTPMKNGLGNGQRRCADESIKRRSRRTRFRCRDSFHSHYVAIIDEARTLILAVLDLSLEPASHTACTRLTVAGRELKRRCNRLVYKLGRKAVSL